MDRGAALEARRAFAVLKPLCTQLLDVSLISREDRALVLDSLRKILEDISSAGLQRCMDYTLFPLLLLLDAAVAPRSSSSSAKSPAPGKNQIMVIGDRIAEGVLSCVEIILRRCIIETSEQVTMLLHKLTAAAMLSVVEAAEEFRHGVLKCLLALLHNLRQCDNGTCLCKTTSSSPFVSLTKDPMSFFVGSGCENTRVEEFIEAVDGCALGHMKTESMLPAVGHLISILLQIAEAEVARGAVGSGRLRRDALLTLRVLILKVGTADRLAFFLPGVASGFSKVMGSSRASKLNFGSSFPTATMHTSGVAGWPAAVEEAIKGMTEILVIVLGDEKNAIALEAHNPATLKGAGNLDRGEHVTASAALETLQELSIRLHKSVQEKRGSGEGAVPESGSHTKPLAIIAQEKQQTIRTVHADQVAKGGALALQTERNKEWLDATTSHLTSLLSQTFPLLCAHQSASVRLAVAESGAILLATCGSTLKSCTSLFLECLLALACDDWTHVASAAQTYLTLLLAPLRNLDLSGVSMDNTEEHYKHVEMRKQLLGISASMLDQLPRVVFSADVSISVLHGRRLAAAMYFLGPDFVSEHLLGTMVAKQKFIHTLTQCLSINTKFTGSLEQILSRNSIVSEVKPGGKDDDLEREPTSRPEQGIEAEELPTMPPWLSLGTGTSRLYHVLAFVLRLAGLSAVTDRNGGTSLISLMELLLVNLRRATADLSHYLSSKEKLTSGQMQRMAATSVCILNEIIYGASGAWNKKLFTEFGDHMLCKVLQKQPAKIVSNGSGQAKTTEQEHVKQDAQPEVSEKFLRLQSLQGSWQAASKDDVRKILSECAGDILHDYLTEEVWEQPTDLASAFYGNRIPMSHSQPVQAFQDNAFLQMVLVEGVGVLAIALGKAFEEGGYLGLVLFPLLEKLACSNYRVHHAAAVSLSILCSHCGYASVRELVVANMDFVIDSLCRQFRHLTMYPRAPDLLAAILHHTNASAHLLPLLQEPLRGVVLELDVLARQSHPQFTVPLLRALREITRASREEAGTILSKAVEACASCKLLLEKESDRESTPVLKACSMPEQAKVLSDSDVEELVNNFIERRRCRCAVAAIATSCLVASGPLLASKDPQPCLLALDTVEDGIATLSHTEDAAAYEIKEKEYIDRLCEIGGYLHPSGSLTSASSKDENESNKLLPTMNRLWPHLVLCLQHVHTSVVIRAVAVVASVINDCGGDFFTRRFQKDALPLVVKLLCGEGSTPLHGRKLKNPGLLMLHGSNTQAPAAVVKVQVAVLKGIAGIAARKKSSSALAGSFSLIAAWVVIMACGMETLREVATDAALALSSLDPDFVWVLVVDLIYGSLNQEFKRATPMGFPDFHTIFPPMQSARNAMSMQLVSYEFGQSNLSLNAAQNLLTRLEMRNCY